MDGGDGAEGAVDGGGDFGGMGGPFGIGFGGAVGVEEGGGVGVSDFVPSATSKSEETGSSLETSELLLFSFSNFVFITRLLS